MKWQGRRGSRNIEDRRRMSVGKTAGVGGIGALVIVLIGMFMGVDVSSLLNNPAMSGGQTQSSAGGEMTEAEKRAGDFVSVTLADTEEIWSSIFRDQLGKSYNPVTLVLFKGSTPSACGGANGATGPFYCPGDEKVFLDTAFFSTLARQMGAKGDFAAAYVVAHEVAHHVQDELGILSDANKIRRQVDTETSNAISVRIELQADCYSGIWARHAKERFGSIERGDIAEAMNAAKQIGDDTLQRNAGQRVMPHTFTHGTSEQRQRWFRTGYESGDVDACNTFGTDNL